MKGQKKVRKVMREFKKGKLGQRARFAMTLKKMRKK